MATTPLERHRLRRPREATGSPSQKGKSPDEGTGRAAADAVSALTPAQFAVHAQMHQALSTQAAAVHEIFLNTLDAYSASYAATEAATATAMS